MLKAKDIMTTPVVTMQDSATVAEAVALMKEKNVRCLIKAAPLHFSDRHQAQNLTRGTTDECMDQTNHPFARLAFVFPARLAG